MKTKLVKFGLGKVYIMKTQENGEFFDSGVAFKHSKKPNPIGDPTPEFNGLDTDQIGCFIRFHFGNSESVQVLIEELILVRDSLSKQADEGRKKEK